MDEKLFTCLNGSLVLAHRAAVAVADRGFRYGDGLFETIRVERCVPLYWDAHMLRMADGLRALSIEFDVDALQSLTKKLLKKNEAQDGFLRIAISRGVGSRGYAPFPPGMPVTHIIEWTSAEHKVPEPARLYLSSLARIPPACLPTSYKLAQGLNSSLAALEAQKAKADEALQLAIDGAISEASSANIFWFKEGTLFTPSLETGCLGGITRDTVLRISPFPTRIVREGPSTLADAECVFLTNCRVGIWPVASLAPAGLNFAPNHAVHRLLAGLLAQDRQRQFFADRKLWGHK